MIQQVMKLVNGVTQAATGVEYESRCGLTSSRPIKPHNH